MIRLVSSACIHASVEDTWAVLSQVENIYMWSEPVEKSFCSGAIDRGVGTERTCVLKGNITITEKWVAWDEGRSFTYVGFNLPLTKSAKNTWTVVPEQDQTLLTSVAEIELNGGIFGKVIEPLMLFMARRMGANAMAALKYLVEEGKPYEGRHSSLVRAPVAC